MQNQLSRPDREITRLQRGTSDATAIGSRQYGHVQSRPGLLVRPAEERFNVLTSAALDPIAKIPGLKVRAVGTEPTAEAAK